MGKDIGTEIPQTDQGLRAGVGDGDSSLGRSVRDEKLVIGRLTETNQDGGLGSVLADLTRTLNGQPAAGAGIAERAGRPRLALYL